MGKSALFTADDSVAVYAQIKAFARIYKNAPASLITRFAGV